MKFQDIQILGKMLIDKQRIKKSFPQIRKILDIAYPRICFNF